MGADGVELDVMLSSDGHVVVRHDSSVERTTDGCGRVRELTLEQLKDLDAGAWFGPQFVGERIPTLEQVLQWAGHDMLLNVELKTLKPLSTGLEEKVARLIRQYHLSSRVILSSFNPFALRRVKKISPQLHTGLLYAPGLPIYLRRAWLRPLAQPDALHPQFKMVGDGFLRWANGMGYRVNVWAPVEADDLQRLIAQRVDMIITDRPDVLAAELRKPS